MNSGQVTISVALHLGATVISAPPLPSLQRADQRAGRASMLLSSLPPHPYGSANALGTSWPAAPALPPLAAPALSGQLLSCTKFAAPFAKVAAFPFGALNVRQPNLLLLVS